MVPAMPPAIERKPFHQLLQLFVLPVFRPFYPAQFGLDLGGIDRGHIFVDAVFRMPQQEMGDLVTEYESSLTLIA